jgi:hypothetical protein
MFLCMNGRRRSSTRFSRRTFSFRFSSSSWKTGVSDGFNTVMVSASTSTSPVVSSGFTVPAGRLRTRPFTSITNSLRSPSAVLKVSGRSGSHTT